MARSRRDTRLTMDDRISRVRELHTPVEQRYVKSVAHYCHGCDLGPHPEDYPDWPCSTAEIVYTPEEIADVRAYEAAQDQRV
jgi:dolichyl-phosphate-mannose--protein O-mannosyl transferase